MTRPSGDVAAAEQLVGSSDRWECVHFVASSRHADFLALRDRGFFVAEVSGRALSSDAELFAAMSVSLRFPSFFGENWDALADCLGGLEWFDGDRFVLLVGRATWLTQPLGRLIEVWLSAAQEWSAQGTPFHLVILVD
jgi:RNAse (barnase) inhibitor barstar